MLSGSVVDESLEYSSETVLQRSPASQSWLSIALKTHSKGLCLFSNRKSLTIQAPLAT